MNDATDDVFTPDSSRHPDGNWRDGVSGNPAGRPAGVGSVVVELRRQIQIEGTDGRTPAEVIAERLIGLAIDGDLRAIKECFDRLDGSPKRSIAASNGISLVVVTGVPQPDALTGRLALKDGNQRINAVTFADGTVVLPTEDRKK